MLKKGQKQKSFVLYTDYAKHVDLLSEEEAGRLLKALFKFVEDGTEPEFTGALNMCFSFISTQIERDKEKYNDVCQKRAEAGRKGGKQKQANLANAKNDKQKQANLADNENDTENVIDTENVTEIKKIKYSKEFEKFWEIYPKKVDKGQAYKKYLARLTDGYHPDELISAAANYKEQCEKQRTEQRFIKHAKTFLGDTLPFSDYINQNNRIQNQNDADDDNVNPFSEYLKHEN